MWGTVPLLPVTVESDTWVPIKAVGSGGMGCKGGVVDGGGVVGASGGGDRHIYEEQKINEFTVGQLDTLNTNLSKEKILHGDGK